MRMDNKILQNLSIHFYKYEIKEDILDEILKKKKA